MSAASDTAVANPNPGSVSKKYSALLMFCPNDRNPPNKTNNKPNKSLRRPDEGKKDVSEKKLSLFKLVTASCAA